MSNVITVGISMSKPANAGPDPSGVKTSGSSNGSFSFIGVYASPLTVVVISFPLGMANAIANSTSDGAVVVPGAGGQYLLLTLNQTDIKNWTVRVRTDKDSPGTGVTFTGGNGGGE